MPEGLAISALVLADHVNSADWAGRPAQFVAKAPSEVLVEVTATSCSSYSRISDGALLSVIP